MGSLVSRQTIVIRNRPQVSGNDNEKGMPMPQAQRIIGASQRIISAWGEIGPRHEAA